MLTHAMAFTTDLMWCFTLLYIGLPIPGYLQQTPSMWSSLAQAPLKAVNWTQGNVSGLLGHIPQLVSTL